MDQQQQERRGKDRRENRKKKRTLMYDREEKHEDRAVWGQQMKQGKEGESLSLGFGGAGKVKSVLDTEACLVLCPAPRIVLSELLFYILITKANVKH